VINVNTDRFVNEELGISTLPEKTAHRLVTRSVGLPAAADPRIVQAAMRDADSRLLD